MGKTIAVFFGVWLFSMAGHAQSVRTHNFKDDGFSLELPKTWATPKGYKEFAALVAFSPLVDAKDDFRENLNVVVEAISGHSVESFFLAHLNNYQTSLEKFSIKTMGYERVGGIMAKWMVYEHSTEKHELKVKAWYVIRDNRSYVITCSAQDSTFSDYLTSFDSIVASFTFLP